MKEKRTYVKHGDEYTLTTYDKKRKLQSRITYKRMSKGDAEERWDDYKDAIKDYKKDLKTIVINMMTSRITMIMVMATITAMVMVMTMVIPMADIMTVRIVDQNQIQVIVVKI